MVDDNAMVCEDLTIADVDGNGKMAIVASGRTTRNLIVDWNRMVVNYDEV